MLKTSESKSQSYLPFLLFCMFKIQFFISAKLCTTAACCGCVVQRRQDNMRAWHITRMSPVSQPSRSLWHSLRRHRGKGESYIHFVLSQRASAGGGLQYPHHKDGARASLLALICTSLLRQCLALLPVAWAAWDSLFSAAASSTAPHLPEALCTTGFVEPWVGRACCCCCF